jgi:hypothetical protein
MTVITTGFTPYRIPEASGNLPNCTYAQASASTMRRDGLSYFLLSKSRVASRIDDDLRFEKRGNAGATFPCQLLRQRVNAEPSN